MVRLDGLYFSLIKSWLTYLHDNPDEIAKEMAGDFRKRRIEKNLTREEVARKSGVAVSNIVRFEQKGLILEEVGASCGDLLLTKV